MGKEPNIMTPAPMPDPGSQHRRKQFVVNKSFQFRVVWRLVGLMLGSMILLQALIIVYMKIRESLNPSSQSLLYFANQLTETLTFGRVVEALWLPMTLSTLAGGAVILIAGILISHRVAGPLYNLKRMMKQIEDGNFDQPMKIRTKDEFHDVEEAFNHMLAALKANQDSLAQLVAGLPTQERKKFESLIKSGSTPAAK
jgi:nitrogen fixation/metabolism regulation signal transduction histidine kinase